MTTGTTKTFTPPSPGAWELEQTHFTRPPSVFMADAFPAPMMRGFRDAMRAYGALLEYIEVAVINGFIYTAPRPVGAPKSARGVPPRPVFALLRRLHPEIRRRVRRAEEVFQTRYWREEARRWDEEVKPAMLAESRRLLGESLEAYSDGELAGHVRRASAFMQTAIYNHHRFNVCAALPIGDLLVHAMEWTGLTAGALLQTMKGLSPVSAGAVAELATLRRAILADSPAWALLSSDRPEGEILGELLRRDDEVGAAARAYLDVVGLRVIGGYDVCDRHGREFPELLVKIVRAAVSEDETARRVAAEQALDKVRARVPAAHVAQFDELLEEARQTYRIRDERVFHGDAVAVGIMRRGILAAGKRLQARGAVHDPEDLVDATADEIIALLEGQPGPTAAELAARAQWRRETPLSAAPATLGFPPSPPPKAEWLPGAAARLQRIVTLVLSLMFDVRKEEPHASGKPAPRTGEGRSRFLKGFAVSPGTYEGPVRIVRGEEDLAKVQQGEVLVATSTGPTFNVVLPLIGALVTERGGVLSHAAIVSREYGLPGIVGCAGATTLLRDGQRVRVDGESGEVCTLS